MFYVYFDKDTKYILSISNEEDATQDFVTKQKEDVIDFLTGEKNIAEYKFDRDFNITNIIQQTPSVNELILKVPYNKNSDICIFHDSAWKFKLNQNNNINYNSNLLFAVTQKDNPNILIRNLVVSSSTLRDQESISFKYPIEENLENISLWVFNCPYTCGLAND